MQNSIRGLSRSNDVKITTNMDSEEMHGSDVDGNPLANNDKEKNRIETKTAIDAIGAIDKDENNHQNIQPNIGDNVVQNTEDDHPAINEERESIDSSQVDLSLSNEGESESYKKDKAGQEIDEGEKSEQEIETVRNLNEEDHKKVANEDLDDNVENKEDNIPTPNEDIPDKTMPTINNTQTIDNKASVDKDKIVSNNDIELSFENKYNSSPNKIDNQSENKDTNPISRLGSENFLEFNKPFDEISNKINNQIQPHVPAVPSSTLSVLNMNDNLFKTDDDPNKLEPKLSYPRLSEVVETNDINTKDIEIDKQDSLMINNNNNDFSSPKYIDNNANISNSPSPFEEIRLIPSHYNNDFKITPYNYEGNINIKPFKEDRDNLHKAEVKNNIDEIRLKNDSNHINTINFNNNFDKSEYKSESDSDSGEIELGISKLDRTEPIELVRGGGGFRPESGEDRKDAQQKKSKTTFYNRIKDNNNIVVNISHLDLPNSSVYGTSYRTENILSSENKPGRNEVFVVETETLQKELALDSQNLHRDRRSRHTKYYILGAVVLIIIVIIIVVSLGN